MIFQLCRDHSPEITLNCAFPYSSTNNKLFDTCNLAFSFRSPSSPVRIPSPSTPSLRIRPPICTDRRTEALKIVPDLDNHPGTLRIGPNPENCLKPCLVRPADQVRMKPMAAWSQRLIIWAQALRIVPVPENCPKP